MLLASRSPITQWSAVSVLNTQRGPACKCQTIRRRDEKDVTPMSWKEGPPELAHYYPTDKSRKCQPESEAQTCH